MSNIPTVGFMVASVPRFLRGRGSNELIYFNIGQGVNPSQYRVMHESLDCGWKSLGCLKECVPLPAVYFPAYAKLLVVGTNAQGQQVRLVGELKRGYEYDVPNLQCGDYALRGHLAEGCTVAIKA